MACAITKFELRATEVPNLAQALVHRESVCIPLAQYYQMTGDDGLERINSWPRA
jgi:hypothetical protein